MHALLVPALLLAIASPDGRQNDDPTNVIFALTIDNGKGTLRGTSRRIARPQLRFAKTKKREEEETAPPKIHPLLEATSGAPATRAWGRSWLASECRSPASSGS
jgi:hypothetical protein